MYNVFLGGSCYPTTWRNDVAIPFLQDHLITYFNPQVEEWDSSLIHSEVIAKLSSDIILFVIDDKTNAVASIVEAAYYIGKARKVVLCVKMLAEDTIVAGSRLSPPMIKDLNRGREYLKEFARQSNVPVYTSVPDALQRVLLILRNSEF